MGGNEMCDVRYCVWVVWNLVASVCPHSVYCYYYYYFLALPSKKSLASLIFVAKYGEPPRSGWFNNMILRCASFTLALVTADSLNIAVCLQTRSGIIRQYSVTNLKPRIKAASRLFILGSNPPLWNLDNRGGLGALGIFCHS